MKAVVYYNADDLRWEDVETPKIGPNEVLVRARACGLCSTDVWKALYKRAKAGSVLGHEVSGEVAETGSNVNAFEVGDRVAVYHRAECGGCYYCKHGQEPLCGQYREQSIFPGAFAEYIRAVPRLVEKSIIKLPDELTFDEATLIEPTACSVRAVSKCGIGLGDNVLVVGDGPLGLLNTQVSKCAGASVVMLSGHHDYRLGIAGQLKIDHVFNLRKVDVRKEVMKLTDGRGADFAIVAVASTDAVYQSMGLVRNGGKICVFGDFRDVPQPNLDLDLKLVLRDGVDIFGSWGCSTQNYRVAFDLVTSGQVRVREMITHSFPLEKFAEALKLFSSKECLKIVLNP
jgi:L-iditol 2-dehydrogenase